MGHQYQCSAFVSVQAEQQLGDMCAGFSIKIAGRFIGKQDRGLTGKSARYRYPLLFTTGEQPRIVVLPMS